MFKKFKDFLNRLVYKIVEYYEAEDNEEKEYYEDDMEVDMQEEKEQETIFDIIDEVKLSIVPFKIYFPEKYVELSEKIDKILKRCQQYYAKDESYLTVSISPESFNTKAEVNKIKTEIREFKRNEFNYILINSKIERLIKLLEENYFKVMVYKDNKLCNEFINTFSRVVNEFNKLEFDNDVFKMQIINYNFTKTVYYLHKYKIWTNYKEDLEFTKFYRSSNIKKIFFKDVQDLLEKVDKIKQSKHCLPLKMFFENILCNENYDLSNENLFKEFLNKEKKWDELYFHYN